ncbi:protein FAM8A1 isoform X2 [Xenopus tropicalis]|uniref:Protein FAM8A1 isoform X2 n=1 Tax=Xenopus tropicalis TaxID=8364 RepID=A0A8J1JP96_XENTR|nr:protein FAM8A1 isoform X2 [Xenopus tropicalis]
MMAEEEECGAMLRERKVQGGSEQGACAPRPNTRMSAAEYTRQLQEWLWQCYCGSLCWQNSCAATTAVLMMNAASSSSGEPGRLSSSSSSAIGRATSTTTTSAPTGTIATAAAGREYVIPTLAQRFRAEMVDFFILFFIKAAFILSIMHISGIKDISKFTMHYIIEEVDEDTSMEDLQKMMVVALIYRIVVCFYEINNTSCDQELLHCVLLPCIYHITVFPT